MIFMLCGTRDARELALSLSSEGLQLLASVVTASAAERLEAAGIRTRIGRLDQDGMISCLRKEGCSAIVDASHPFAQEAHAHAMRAAAVLGLPYWRYERRSVSYDKHPRLMVVHSYEEAARRAKQLEGSIMLTTGGKTLEVFAGQLLGNTAIRLTVRLLPCLENIQKCICLGIEQRNIIAMQGPFSREMNEALYRQYGTQVMVTKESGAEGSLDEKVHAALDMGLYVILIARPQTASGDHCRVYQSFDEIVLAVTALYKK